MQILVGSKKGMKVDAVRSVLKQLTQQKYLDENWAVEGREVSSGVPPTPQEIETMRGAEVRALSLIDKYRNEEDIFVGIESGLIKRNNILFEEAWCVVIDREGNKYYGVSSALPVPGYIVDRMKAGEKHTEILDKIWEEMKMGTKDTWGVYTKGVLLRETGLEESFRNAFVQYLVSFKEKDPTIHPG